MSTASRPSFSVFMSTHDGERFLPRQLDSILGQQDVSVSLWVRDDGSTDGTRDILSGYAARHANVHVDFGDSLGVGRSFMSLVFDSLPGEDFYAFADQDDLWDPDKLSTAATALAPFADSPKLYVCNQRCVDMDGHFLAERFPRDFPLQTLVNVLFSNLYAGCTMVFNNPFRGILCDPARRPPLEFFRHRIHDAWLSCLASSAASIVFDPSPHMSFRRHAGNATDAEVFRNRKIGFRDLWTRYARKIDRRLKKRTNAGRGSEWTARQLLAGYADHLSGQDRDLLLLVRDYRHSFPKKCRLLFGPVLSAAVPEKKFDFRLKILLNRL